MPNPPTHLAYCSDHVVRRVPTRQDMRLAQLVYSTMKKLAKEERTPEGRAQRSAKLWGHTE